MKHPILAPLMIATVMGLTLVGCSEEIPTTQPESSPEDHRAWLSEDGLGRDGELP